MRKLIFGSFIISIGIIIGIFVQPTISGDNVYKEYEKFQIVFNTAYKNYVEEIEAGVLIEEAIKGMLGKLDVHSVYIPPEQKKKVDEEFQGYFYGIGVQFDIIEDSITVVTALSGGPSEKLGINSGDKIVKIDGEDAVGIPQSDVPKRLKGPKGTLVTVDIKRTGEKELLHFEIIRDKIPDWSLDAKFMIDKTDIGYLRFNRFSETTHKEMMEAIDEMKQQGMKRLVVDLRYNPGGYLNQAFLMANEFLGGGDTIVYTKGRRPEFNEVHLSEANGTLQKIPLIVLVNEGSASASEIVSGAMQDLDRAIVVGETTFGKGLVQRQYPLPDNSAFRITISYYYTPSGRSIQRPYKDKDAYQHLAGRLELEDGQLLTDALLIKQKEADSTGINLDSMIYTTRKGRKVLGGGGITPDYIVKETRLLEEFTVELRKKRIITIFVDNLLNESGNNLKKQYEKDFVGFLRNYKLTKNDWDSFKSLSESKEIEWKQDQFDKDADWIENQILGTIANVIWTRHESRQVNLKVDKQFLKAIDLFPEAEKIISYNEKQVKSNKK